ncbi:MAG: T9SS type A sorting domain-containing protein [Bacteroidota bacterium]
MNRRRTAIVKAHAILKAAIVLILLLSTFCSHGSAQDVACELLTDSTTYWPASAVDKPEYLQSVTDPVFGTKITRIVGNPGDAIPNIPGAVWAAQQERHEYSKLSVWNCDQSMMYLNRHYPNLWLDGSTYEVLFTRTKPSEYVLWSHTEPHVMYHTGKSGNCRLGKWDVVADIDSELVDLRAYSSCSFGESEGNFSWDGTKVAIYGKRIVDNKYVIFVVDVPTKTKGQDIEVANFDNCTMSPKGNYVIITYGSDLIKVLHAADGTLAWLEYQYGLPSHFDVQIDQNGDEVIAGVGKTSPYNGLVIKRRLSDGVITALTRSGYASHTSGRNLKRPGWVFVTYQNLQTNEKYLPYINELDAVRLDGSRVERICNLRVNKYLFPTPDDQYIAEAHGCPSPDGLRVIFASDWNKGSYPVQAYVVDFRDKVVSTSVLSTDATPAHSAPSLVNNYPNPFNPQTIIMFQLPTAADVTLTVFDVLGREVARIVDGELQAGSYRARFEASHLRSGVYFYRLRSGTFFQTRRMLLLK